MSTETKKTTQIRDKSQDAPRFGRRASGDKLTRGPSNKSHKTNHPPSYNNNNNKNNSSGSNGKMRIKKALQKSTKESPEGFKGKEDENVPGHLKEFLASIAISKGQTVREARKKKEREQSGSSDSSESSSSESEEEIPITEPEVHNASDDSSEDESEKDIPLKKNSLSETDYTQIRETTKFSEFEIHNLWNQFKDNFPSGRLNRQQLSQLLSQIFRKKADNALVVENIMRLFDTDGSGFISFRELIVAFSMSMKGSIDEKLHWAFKLYDQDNSNEIDEDEMIEIFQRLCRIATGGVKSHEPELPSEKEKNTAILPQIVKPMHTKPPKKKKQVIEDVEILSSKLNERIETRKRRSIHSHSETSTPIPGSPIVTRVKGKKKDVYVPFQDKKKEEEVQRLLEERERNCELFDARQRAIEIFQSLDTDGNGYVTEEEFIRGCQTDDSFIILLNSFNGSGIWC